MTVDVTVWDLLAWVWSGALVAGLWVALRWMINERSR